MSKRLSQSNTLLNYFQSPKAKKTESKASVGATEAKRLKCPDNADHHLDDETDELEDIIAPVKKKRARILSMDSDSDTENIDPPKQTNKKTKVEAMFTKSKAKSNLVPCDKNKSRSDEDVKDDSSTANMEDSKTTTIRKLKDFKFGSAASSSKAELKSVSLDANKSKPTKDVNGDIGPEKGKWLHENLPFLKPDKLMDANRRRPDHPEYDKSTLYVPKDYFDKLTPGMRQWWELKSDHFDTVLFFKVGRFYELYHMDATVGVERLGFTYMKGEFAHSGFPEISYGRMSASLVDQGYKVARVEQTETPEMMAERCKNMKRPTKFDKVVKREVCQVSQKGVSIFGAQTLNVQEAQGCYMIAICEALTTQSIWKHFGVCFVDTSIGQFYMAEFDDDKHCSRLLTLTAQHKPALILLERGGMSNDTMETISTHLKDVKKEILSSGKQFPQADGTIETLKSECYFRDEKGNHEWPEIFDKFIEDKNFPRMEYMCALRSLGACIWYLKKFLIDVHVLQSKKFALYVPVDLQSKVESSQRAYMVVDNVTIENLNLLENEGSLQTTMDFCCTAFGRRLFQTWICRPLSNVVGIKKRQDAVRELYNNLHLLKSAREMMAKLPDIERQIVKIHRFGNAYVAKNHPDARAVLYEAKSYNKHKIADLMCTLEALATFQKITSLFQCCASRLLQKLTRAPPEGDFVDLEGPLSYFQNAFDHEQANQNGAIIPQAGVDADYDAAQDKIKRVQRDLDAYLEEQRKFFRCDVKYAGTDKKRFQIEVPEKNCSRANSEYKIEGSKKGSKPCNKYSTNRSRELLAAMIKAEGEQAKVLMDLNRRIFEKFGKMCHIWEKALQCITILDCLCSLAEYAKLQSEDICIPTVLPFSEQPICIMENARHPCLNTEKIQLVSNDIHLGRDGKQPLMILTGPNMGGKSTFMRQTVLIAIMAQIGGYVPASQCEISMVDRIFTRMGGQDDIMRGRSTFLVELMEASSILRHANCNSFVLLDELGRGTSTHDGNAIASGYLDELSSIQCRGIFATHYHTLVQKFDRNDKIQLGYMTCMLQNEGTENESVVFLYKVAEGLWPKSYGFNVALLAGMPRAIVDSAKENASTMERKDRNRNLVKVLMNLESVMRMMQVT